MRRIVAITLAAVSATVLARAGAAQTSTTPAPPADSAQKTAPAEEADVATYANRFLQTTTPLVNQKGIFEGSFNHRFYESVIDQGGSKLWGLDSGASVTFGVDYVPVKNVAVQILRAAYNADYEFAVKATLLRPRKDMPLAVGVRGGVNWLTATYAPRQSSGFAQVPVAVSLGSRFTIAATPSWTQRTPTRIGVINVPLAAQFMITPSTAAIAEFVPQYGPDQLKAQWSFGLEKSVLHHKFALWIGNSGATTVDQMLASDYQGGVRDYNIRLGFNLIRQFDLGTD